MGSRPPQDHGGNRREALAAWGLDRLLDFSASINPLGQPAGLRDDLVAGWDDTLHYPDRGAPGFVAAASRAWALPVERLLAGNGSAELFDLVLRGLAPRRLVLCPPDFGLYEGLVPAGLPVVRVPRAEAEGFAVDRAALAETIAEGDLVLFSNPANPAGCAASRRDLRALRTRCEERGAILAVDEAFADFCPTESVLPDVSFGGGLLVFRSLTKFFGIPGLRLGFLAAAPELVRRAAALQVPWSVGALAQRAGLFCLSQEGWAERTLDYVARAREALRCGLAAIPGFRPLPSQANYLLVELSRPAPSAADLYERLARRGILVRHCGSFGLGERYVRVAVRTTEENDTLLEALRRLGG